MNVTVCFAVSYEVILYLSLLRIYENTPLLSDSQSLLTVQIANLMVYVAIKFIISKS